MTAKSPSLIIREVLKLQNQHCETTICVLRSDHYCSTLEFFNELLEAAQEDFSELTERDVVIRKFGGRHYKGTFGIEFGVSVGSVPQRYQEIHELECSP